MDQKNRRKAWRYRFEQPLEFTVVRRDTTWAGSGCTTEIAAGGLLFQSEGRLNEGEDVEVQMPWPVLAQGVCPVILVIQGRVMRSDARGTALRMEYYAFHMAGARSFDVSGASGGVCNLIG